MKLVQKLVACAALMLGSMVYANNEIGGYFTLELIGVYPEFSNVNSHEVGYPMSKQGWLKATTMNVEFWSYFALLDHENSIGEQAPMFFLYGNGKMNFTNDPGPFSSGAGTVPLYVDTVQGDWLWVSCDPATGVVTPEPQAEFTKSKIWVIGDPLTTVNYDVKFKFSVVPVDPTENPRYGLTVAAKAESSNTSGNLLVNYSNTAVTYLLERVFVPYE